jgi:riboflavin biosynthesis pyrimidine reductase
VDLERLWERVAPASGPTRGGRLPADLQKAYDGDLLVPLRPDRPTVIANFVSTLDGVVAFDTDESSGGGEVSGFFDPDRFIMGLLRSMADVVLVGAGTVRASPTHEWTGRHVHPGTAVLYGEWRDRLGLAAQPTTIVATARGNLDPAHPGLSAAAVPVILVTTPAGASRLAGAQLAPNARVEVAGTGPGVAARDLVEAARSAGAVLILCEGGPHLIGDLLGAELLDELFLTIAPQIAGRDMDAERYGFVEGLAFTVAEAPWAELVSVRRADDHLFLRYRFERGGWPATAGSARRPRAAEPRRRTGPGRPPGAPGVGGAGRSPGRARP